MTIKELEQIYPLGKEIERIEFKIDEKRQTIYGVSSPNMEGMPKAQGNRNANYERVIQEIVILEEKLKRKIDEKETLEQWINDIDDSFLRLIFTLRYIDNLRWLQVAMRIGTSEDSVKKACYRFIKFSNEKF